MHENYDYEPSARNGKGKGRGKKGGNYETKYSQKRVRAFEAIIGKTYREGGRLISKK